MNQFKEFTGNTLKNENKGTSSWASLIQREPV